MLGSHPRSVRPLIEKMQAKAAEMPAGPERDFAESFSRQMLVMDKLLGSIEGGAALADPEPLALLAEMERLDPEAERAVEALAAPRRRKPSEGAMERARALRAARKAKDERPII